LSPRAAYLRCDRFLLPSGDAAVLRHFLDHHFVAHSARERLRGLAARRTARWGMDAAARFLLLGRAPAMAERPEGDGHLRRSFHRGGVEAGGRWIQLLDPPGRARAGCLTFVFPPGRSEPAVVVKMRPEGAPGSSLRGEWETTVEAWYRLTPALRSTMPEPLAFSDDDGVELLTLSFVPGRPAYVELRNRLSPARAVRTHMEAAAGWLADFHEATADAVAPVDPERDLPDPERLTEALERMGGAEGEGGGRKDLRWYHELRESLAARPLPATAVHGDFWARNLLLGVGDVPGVVDWEGYRTRGSPARDLFHFPLTYGLAYPWIRSRRTRPVEAFRRTFLERNRVSAAVRRYLWRYARRSGIERALLRSLLLVRLLEEDGGGGSGMRPSFDGGKAARRSAYTLLRRAQDTVFSP
jgi:hypothetical protein